MVASQITSEYIENLTEKVTLNVFSAGCDRTNFIILNSLPIKTKSLGDKIKITKMPLNKRLNDLEKVGLLRRIKSEGKIEKTILTDRFICMINQMKKDVIKDLSTII